MMDSRDRNVLEKLKAWGVLTSVYIVCLLEQQINTQMVKCKAMPAQAWRGPKCSRRLRLPDFKTIGI
jgi:hypothetical protein